MFSKVCLDIDAFILITNPLSELSLVENDALHQNRDRLTDKQTNNERLPTYNSRCKWFLWGCVFNATRTRALPGWTVLINVSLSINFRSGEQLNIIMLAAKYILPQSQSQQLPKQSILHILSPLSGCGTIFLNFLNLIILPGSSYHRGWRLQPELKVDIMIYCDIRRDSPDVIIQRNFSWI